MSNDEENTREFIETRNWGRRFLTMPTDNAPEFRIEIREKWKSFSRCSLDFAWRWVDNTTATVTGGGATLTP